MIINDAAEVFKGSAQEVAKTSRRRFHGALQGDSPMSQFAHYKQAFWNNN